jgi:methyl-accepting chemotaxis protein
MKTISSRMITALVALLLCTITLATIGWVTQNRAATALRQMYQDSVIPIRNLKVISDRFAVNIVDTVHKVSDGNLTMHNGQSEVTKALMETDTLWTGYRTAATGSQRAALIASADAPLSVARKAGESILKFMREKDQPALQEFRSNALYPAIDPASDIIGKLIELELEEARALEENAVRFGNIARLLLMVSAVLAITMCVGAVFYVIRGVIRPLRQSIQAMKALAEATVGALPAGIDRLSVLESVSISGTERKDELGEMAQTLQTFKEAGIERQRLRSQADKEQAERHERSQKIEEIIGEFESATAAIVTSVAASSHELEASAKSMMDVARTTSEQSNMVAAAAHQASQSVHSLSATGDELALSIGEIGRQAEQSSVYASNAADKARTTDATVTRLNAAGQSIVEVIDLIKTIAAQTNLLALNATIEAARAGEAGRGFAVVASEVKELAAQTTKATDVIAEHVLAIQTASSESIDAMREITQMIEEINQVASAIAVAVTEQSQATQGIAENVQQVAQGTAHASESIAIVNEAATNTGTAASQVLSASEELAQQSQMMRDKVDWFLHAVRAA